MLMVTAPAKELLRAIDTPEDRALRLDPVEGGQLSFVAGPPRPDDQVVEDSGSELLRISGEVSQQLDGHNLDRVETADGPGFTISRPDQPAPVS